MGGGQIGVRFNLPKTEGVDDSATMDAKDGSEFAFQHQWAVDRGTGAGPSGIGTARSLVGQTSHGAFAYVLMYWVEIVSEIVLTIKSAYPNSLSIKK